MFVWVGFPESLGSFRNFSVAGKSPLLGMETEIEREREEKKQRKERKRERERTNPSPATTMPDTIRGKEWWMISLTYGARSGG